MTKQNGVYLLIGNELKEVKNYDNEADAKIIVIYEGTGVLVSPKTLGEASYYRAMEIAKENGVKLGNTPDWAIVGLYLRDVNYAVKLLGHDPIRGEYWTGSESSSYSAWGCNSYGFLDHTSKYNSLYVRSLSAFPLTL